MDFLIMVPSSPQSVNLTYNDQRKNDVHNSKSTNSDVKIRFYLKWRLEKHMTGHEKLDSKFCHYFNNNKTCPFEQIGCMFKHAKSRKCWFINQGKNNL